MAFATLAIVGIIALALLRHRAKRTV